MVLHLAVHRITRDFIKNTGPGSCPSPLPMMQMHDQWSGQHWDLREVTRGEVGKVLIKGPERPTRVWILICHQEKNPTGLKPRIEAAELSSRKSS